MLDLELKVEVIIMKLYSNLQLLVEQINERYEVRD